MLIPSEFKYSVINISVIYQNIVHTVSHYLEFKIATIHHL